MKIKNIRLSSWLIALLPFNGLRLFAYRAVRRFRIGRNVRIAYAAVLDPDEAEIGDGARIGSLTVVARTRRFRLGKDAQLGVFVRFLVADDVTIGDGTRVLTGSYVQGASWMKQLFPDQPDHRGSFVVGDHTLVTGGHFFDITHDIRIGSNCAIIGRNSTFWTHGVSMDRGGPIVIQDRSIIGSDCRCVAGVTIAENVLVSLGSVITRSILEPDVVAGGVPARILKRDPDWRRGRKA